MCSSSSNVRQAIAGSSLLSIYYWLGVFCFWARSNRFFFAIVMAMT